jgi:hypothetical protein
MTIYNPYNFEKLTKEELIDIIKDCCMADQHSRMDAALKRLLNNEDIRNKIIQLNENIESLIDVAHETYMSTSETDTENKARLDAQIQVYWNVKSMVEDILEIK